MGAVLENIIDEYAYYDLASGSEELSQVKPRNRPSIVDALLPEAVKYMLFWEDVLTNSDLGPGEVPVNEGPNRDYIPTANFYRCTVPALVNNPVKMMKAEEMVPSEELGPAYFTAFIQELYTPQFHPFEQDNITSSRRRIYHAFMAYGIHELASVPGPKGDTPEEKYLNWKTDLYEQSQAGFEKGKQIRENLRLPPKRHDRLAWVASSEFYDRLHAVTVGSPIESLFDKKAMDAFVRGREDHVKQEYLMA